MDFVNLKFPFLYIKVAKIVSIMYIGTCSLFRIIINALKIVSVLLKTIY